MPSIASLLKLSQRCTRKEAEELFRTHPNRVWVKYTTDEQDEVKKNINKKLAEDGIPEAGSKVIRWRMAICLRDVIRQC
jgi:hypothetical protein